jgi:hypothetical protein
VPTPPVGGRRASGANGTLPEPPNFGADCRVRGQTWLDESTGKRFTFFVDPDGLPLELYQR